MRLFARRERRLNADGPNHGRREGDQLRDAQEALTDARQRIDLLKQQARMLRRQE